MKTRKNINAILILSMFFVVACSDVSKTLAPTETPLPTKFMSTPIKTLQPTSTPNVIETQNYVDLFSDVQKFKNDGLIPSTSGNYRVLYDFYNNTVARGYIEYWFSDIKAKYFVYKAHLSWSTAGVTSDTSGCAIVFAGNARGNMYDFYGVVLDRSRIFFSSTYAGHYYDIGKSRGTGKVDIIGDPAEADFMLVVYDYKASVFVNDEFVGEYALSKDRKLEGEFDYGIMSGTNKDYGTRCIIRNSRMWNFSQ